MGASYIERRGMGRMQSRRGPNRTGPFGLLQPVADATKVLLKENIVPAAADKLVHWLAPIVAFAPVLLIFTVLPFQNGAMLADLNIGILFIIAVSSVSTVGVFMAGWSSSNKYSLLGAMRTIATVVSYEIPLALALVSIVILAGTMSMNGIVVAQNIPFILFQPLGFLIFFIAGSAEINRSPFDLMEADSELVAGFHNRINSGNEVRHVLPCRVMPMGHLHIRHHHHLFPGSVGKARCLPAVALVFNRQESWRSSS
jgi:NADH-quinone oxidoreductase subunit H